jgi:hypothetical protein
MPRRHTQHQYYTRMLTYTLSSTLYITSSAEKVLQKIVRRRNKNFIHLQTTNLSNPTTGNKKKIFNNMKMI